MHSMAPKKKKERPLNFTAGADITGNTIQLATERRRAPSSAIESHRLPPTAIDCRRVYHPHPGPSPVGAL